MGVAAACQVKPPSRELNTRAAVLAPLPNQASCPQVVRHSPLAANPASPGSAGGIPAVGSTAAPAAQSLAGRRVPVEELDDDAIGVGDLERALAPGLLAQRHGDVHALLAQAGQLTLQVLDDERQDQA